MKTEFDVDKLFLAYEECRADNTAHFRKINDLQKELEQMSALLKEAKAVIEFYGDRSNWRTPEMQSECKEVISASDLCCKKHDGSGEFALSSGGKRAREFLAKIGDG